ncbi:hypothetical protein [Pseudomonas helleri]|uniref:hypothetical protein n=1 Tax=Pseudomonas helleri TaxID=1608996 RepID=UPI0033422F84
MQNLKFYPVLALAVCLIALTGCGTTSISPAMTGKSGVKYGADRDGYPTMIEIVFVRSTPFSENSTPACIVRGVEQPVSAPTFSDGVWQVTATGAMQWDGGGVSSLPFRYNLSLKPINGTTYTFTRMFYANGGVASASPLMASNWWSPEHAYSAMEEVVGRIDECLSAGR